MTRDVGYCYGYFTSGKCDHASLVGVLLILLRILITELQRTTTVRAIGFPSMSAPEKSADLSDV